MILFSHIASTGASAICISNSAQRIAGQFMFSSFLLMCSVQSLPITCYNGHQLPPTAVAIKSHVLLLPSRITWCQYHHLLFAAATTTYHQEHFHLLMSFSILNPLKLYSLATSVYRIINKRMMKSLQIPIFRLLR